MTDDRVLELVSAGADGALSVEDQADLDRLLESSNVAREFKADLEKMESLFDGISELDPPASLSAQLMNSIDNQPEQKEDFSRTWLRPLQLGAGLRYALAAAAGALLVVVFFEGQSSVPGTPDLSDMVGMMAPKTDSAAIKIVDEFVVSEIGIESQAKLERSENDLVLRVHLNAESPVDLTIDMSKSGARADAVSLVESNFDNVTLADGTLAVKAVGEQGLTILLRRAVDRAIAEDARITLEYSSGGKLLKRGELRPTW